MATTDEFHQDAALAMLLQKEEQKEEAVAQDASDETEEEPLDPRVIPKPILLQCVRPTSVRAQVQCSQPPSARSTWVTFITAR
jgi:hypothetical protein